MKTSCQKEMKEMKEMEELLTFEEVANILKLNKKTIYNYAAADQFFVPILKIGKSKRVRKSDLVNYINSLGE